MYDTSSGIRQLLDLHPADGWSGVAVISEAMCEQVVLQQWAPSQEAEPDTLKGWSRAQGD